MKLFAKCSGCRKRKLYISRKSYILPEVSKLPITSNDEICTTCFLDIKDVTLHKKQVQDIKQNTIRNLLRPLL